MSAPSSSLYPQIQVDEALKTHEALINKLRSTAFIKEESTAHPDQHFDDNFFLVKFCVAFNGDEAKILTAIKNCIAFRIKNKDVLAKLRSGELAKHPDEELVSKYLPLGMHKQALDGSVVFISRPGIAQMDAFVQNHPTQLLKNAILFSKEIVQKICDEETKKRGYFVGMIAITDFKGGSMLSMNKTLMNTMQEAQGEMFQVYPNLLQFGAAVNPLALVKVLGAIVDKLHTCKGKSTRTYPLASCPVGSKYFSPDALPSFLGGTCASCDAKCIAGIPNDQKEKIPLVADGATQK